jgi:hypothetical protein
MRNCNEREGEEMFEDQASTCEAPELSGALGNLARLLFSEAWRAKARTTSPGAFVNLTNLSRDFMRRNVATNHNIPQIALSQ